MGKDEDKLHKRPFLDNLAKIEMKMMVAFSTKANDPWQVTPICHQVALLC
jgi:hypothetical protein